MLPAKPCAGPKQWTALPYRSCSQIGSSQSCQSRSADSLQAWAQRSAPVRSCMTWAASIVPGEPHISSRVGLSTLACTHASRRSSCQSAGASRCATSRIPVSPIHSDGTAPPLSCAKSGAAR